MSSVIPAIPRDILEREMARRFIIEFAKYHDPNYIVDPFHARVGEALDRVLRGEVQRMMIFAPPQHGKSRLASVELPALWLGRNPDMPIISTSYSDKMPRKHAREIQEIIRSEKYRQLFPGIEIDSQQKALLDWGLRGHKAHYIGAGVGGSITGHGAGLGIIDDPYKNYAEASSSSIRETVWNWWESTFSTRIWEGGAIVIMNTRWHPDELCQRILDREGTVEEGGAWVVVNCPALNEDDMKGSLPNFIPDSLERLPGEALAPSRYSAEYLEAKRETLSPLIWAAMYQQRPSSPKGEVVKVDDFQIVDRFDEDLVATAVRWWDPAVGKRKQNDYAVGAKVCRMRPGASYDYLTEHIVRGKYRGHELESIMRSVAERDGRDVPIFVEQEPGSTGQLWIDHLKRNVLHGFSVNGIPSSGDKHIGIARFASMVETGRWALLRAPWNVDFLDEGRHYRGDGKINDDQLDATSKAYDRLTDGVFAWEYKGGGTRRFNHGKRSRIWN